MMSEGAHFPGQQNYLFQVINDATHVATLTASYDILGRLTSLIGANGQPASVGTVSPGAGSGSESVSATGLPTNQQSSTQTIYDSQGDPIRVIKSFVDAGGHTDYLVTVADYQYFTSDVSTQIYNIFLSQTAGATAGATQANMLFSVTQYARHSSCHRRKTAI